MADTMTTDVPPALAQHPQFTPEYWRKVPRQTKVVHIERVTNIEEDDGTPWVEIVFKEGMAFRRKKEEITQLLTANLEVHIEAVVSQGGEAVITGLMVPNVGWAFRMTAEDLAEYTKEVAMVVHTQRQRAKAQARATLRAEIERVVFGHGEYIADDTKPILIEELVGTVMDMLEPTA